MSRPFFLAQTILVPAHSKWGLVGGTTLRGVSDLHQNRMPDPHAHDEVRRIVALGFTQSPRSRVGHLKT